ARASLKSGSFVAFRLQVVLQTQITKSRIMSMTNGRLKQSPNATCPRLAHRAPRQHLEHLGQTYADERNGAHEVRIPGHKETSPGLAFRWVVHDDGRVKW